MVQLALAAAAAALACFIGLVGGGPLWIIGGVAGLIWAYAKAKRRSCGGNLPAGVTTVKDDVDEFATKFRAGGRSRATSETSAVEEVGKPSEKTEKSWTAGDRVVQPTYGVGTVVEIDERRVMIDFDQHGRRAFSASLVVLREPVNPTPRPVASLNRDGWHQARQEQLRAEYEKTFPYDKAPPPPPERVPRRGPEVSGGLPSLGKRRP